MPILLRMPCGGPRNNAPALSAPTDISLKALDGAVCIEWTDPSDIEVGGTVLARWLGTRVVRKTGSAPRSKNDGETVIDSRVRDAYKEGGFVDTGLDNGTEYFYGIFPYTTDMVYTYDGVGSATPKAPVIYGFLIDQDKSDPAGRVIYTEHNADFTPAHMDYSNDVFDYGSWGDVWFIKDLKPCMLNYDGLVSYELDRDNYAQGADGTDSDIADEAFPGNAMVGVPKVYWKCRDNGDETANFYFSDTKVDDTYHCWAHLDKNGDEIDYCYMPAYDGSVIDGVLRSLSGRAPTPGHSAAAEIDQAKKNNLTSDIIWYTEVFSDRILIDLLLILIGRSTDTQAVFGTGNDDSYNRDGSNLVKTTGLLNTKGMFWGNQDHKSGVKVFGMEHWWGNTLRRIAGWIFNKGVQMVKMTYGMSDGSTVEDYNLTGDGYIRAADGYTIGLSEKMYIHKMRFGPIFGMVPIARTATKGQHYCDAMRADKTGVYQVSVGGYYATRDEAGAFYLETTPEASTEGAEMCVSLSCKPLARRG